MMPSTVPASDVRIGWDILPGFGRHLRQSIPSSKVLVITDDNVAPFHASSVKCTLEGAGFTVFMHTIPHGEPSKSLAAYATLINQAIACRIGRGDAFVALGGGVVGDLTGFVAATYLRGIKWVYLPTTLLAMVDASIGGKTGLDLPSGKNLIGTFHQPSVVLIDTMFLRTLPCEEFANGMAEIVKTACLMGMDQLTFLQSIVDDHEILDMITRCVDYKRHIVDLDPFDEGIRKRLNFGHTIGHALEWITNYGMPHGKAVAIGMLEELSIASKYGMNTGDLYKALQVVLEMNHLPTSVMFDWPVLVDAMYVDKKNHDDKIVFEIPDGHGMVYEMSLAHDQLLSITR